MIDDTDFKSEVRFDIWGCNGIGGRRKGLYKQYAHGNVSNWGHWFQIWNLRSDLIVCLEAVVASEAIIVYHISNIPMDMQVIEVTDFKFAAKFIHRRPLVALVIFALPNKSEHCREMITKQWGILVKIRLLPTFLNTQKMQSVVYASVSGRKPFESA